MAKKDIHCPFCRDLLEVNDEWSGMQLTCPHCKKAFIFRDRAKKEESFDDADIELSVKRDPVMQPVNFPQMQSNAANSGNPANIFTALGKYAVFTGRASRREFWLFSLFYSVLAAIFAIASAVTNFILPDYYMLCSAGTVLVILALFLPYLAAMVRRCHDAGRPGARILIALIPCLGWLLLFYTLSKHSEEGDNIYGPNPNGGSKDEVWPVFAGVIFPLIIIGGVFAGMAIFFPEIEKSKESINLITCTNHLTRIGIALESYSRDSDGQKYPGCRDKDGLTILQEIGSESADIFQCPSDKTSSYCYIGRGLEPRHRAYEVPVVICVAHPGNVVNILMADGSVKAFVLEKSGISCAELLNNIREQHEHLDPNDEEAWEKVIKNACRDLHAR